MTNESIIFRPGTKDEAIFQHFQLHNEYRMPDRFGPEDLVVDIGVHIGGFSYSALGRGAGRLVGFEAEPSNYAAARHNLAQFGSKVELHNKAVWRSDRPAGRLHFTPSTDDTNTGGGSMIWGGDGPSVESAPFDDVVRAITNNGAVRIRMLKIDCEGSEFPILLTSNCLEQIDEIAGEFHELPAEVLSDDVKVAGVDSFTIEALAAKLQRSGFSVAWERHGDSNLGLFFAARSSSARTAPGRAKNFLNHLRHAFARPKAQSPANSTSRRT